MNGHILVAVGPSFSDAALSTAIARARETGARLTVLHVIDQTPWWAGTYAEGLCDTQALVNQIALAIQRHSEKMLKQAGMSAGWETRLVPRDGRSIGRLIAQTADVLGADLVVLGTQHRGLLAVGIHHMRRVVRRHADCDVLIATESVRPSASVTRLHHA